MSTDCVNLKLVITFERKVQFKFFKKVEWPEFDEESNELLSGSLFPYCNRSTFRVFLEYFQSDPRLP